MLITNLRNNFLGSHIKSDLSNSDEANIACGYVTAAGLKVIDDEIVQHIRNGKKIKLLLGMAFFEGLRSDDAEKVTTLDTKLRTNNLGGIKVACSNPYHGKLYIFKINRIYKIYIGSSNLSPAGIARNTECNLLLQGAFTDRTVRDSVSFFNDLYQTSFSKDFSEVSSAIPRISERPPRIGQRNISVPTRTGKILTSQYESVQRIALQISVLPRSGLNWNFGAGRPRAWDEAYIPVPTNIQSIGFFPLPGTPFNVTTDDGWQFQCKVAGTGGKNLESHPRLGTLGQWLKRNKLGTVGLSDGQLVTDNHLTNYGRNYIEITRISSSEYFFDFS